MQVVIVQVLHVEAMLSMQSAVNEALKHRPPWRSDYIALRSFGAPTVKPLKLQGTWNGGADLRRFL